MRFALTAVITLLCVLHAQKAAAYCRTATCPGIGTGARCDPPLPTDCGTELFWKSPCVSFSMQKDASEQVSLEVATKIFEDAFATWSNADCGGGKNPRMKAIDLGPAACNVQEYNKQAGNANVIMFHDELWPHPGSNSTLALTTVTYNVETGEIYDADMELNSANVKFSVGDKLVTFDLASVAVHEAGHFLGLSHSTDPSATMFADMMPGSTNLRSLEADDLAGICAAYPPGAAIPSTCDPSPRRGFESECNPPPITKEAPQSCACSAPGTDAHPPSTLAAIALVFGLITKRRRNRLRS